MLVKSREQADFNPFSAGANEFIISLPLQRFFLGNGTKVRTSIT